MRMMVYVPPDVTMSNPKNVASKDMAAILEFSLSPNKTKIFAFSLFRLK